MEPDQHPLNRGFDEFFGHLEGRFRYIPLPGDDPYKSLNTIHPGLQRNRKPALIKEPKYVTELLTDEAVRFIEKNRDDPFFIYLAYNTPHEPMEAKPEKLEQFGYIKDDLRRKMVAMMASLDDGVGRVMMTLHENGLDENTLVFFISDNGGPTLQNGSINSPFFGLKGFLYEGGLRVPFIARWKGVLPEGIVYEHPVSTLDIVPTSVAIAGGKLPADRVYDGVNLIPYLSGKKSGSPHPQLFWRFGAAGAVLIDGHEKLVTLWREGASEYFDLKQSVYEGEDKRIRNPEKISTLNTLFMQWNQELKDPVWPAPEWSGNLQRKRSGLETKPDYQAIDYSN
jgi:arylsulfatase A-like enzyme